MTVRWSGSHEIDRELVVEALEVAERSSDTNLVHRGRVLRSELAALIGLPVALLHRFRLNAGDQGHTVAHWTCRITLPVAEYEALLSKEQATAPLQAGDVTTRAARAAGRRLVSHSARTELWEEPGSLSDRRWTKVNARVTGLSTGRRMTEFWIEVTTQTSVISHSALVPTSDLLSDPNLYALTLARVIAEIDSSLSSSPTSSKCRMHKA